MKKLLILSLIIIAALGDVATNGDFAFEWKSSSLFPNGTVVQACVGDDVMFPWVFDNTSQKQVVIQWSKISENKTDREKLSILALYSSDIFHELSRERDLEFLPNAGIKLPKVTLADKGIYTVEIILFGHPVSYKQVAFLHVSEHMPASCVDVQKYDNVSGVHTLFVNDYRPVKVYCDQSTDNGGWTVIQRRQDGSVDFYRNWEQYEKGFGDLNGEFWIGLANLYQLTKSKIVKLRVDLTDFDGSTAYAVYNWFDINGAGDNYRLYIDDYSGTAGNGLRSLNKMQFSTFDRDHDTDSGRSCAQLSHGAWWYSFCAPSNLNGRYKSDRASGFDGVTWFYWKRDKSLKRVEMKIKV